MVIHSVSPLSPRKKRFTVKKRTLVALLVRCFAWQKMQPLGLLLCQSDALPGVAGLLGSWCLLLTNRKAGTPARS